MRAIYHLLCNEIEAAADWVEKAIEQRDHSMMFHLRFVVCRPLRASARWPKIARLANLPDWRPERATNETLPESLKISRASA